MNPFREEPVFGDYSAHPTAPDGRSRTATGGYLDPPDTTCGTTTEGCLAGACAGG